MKSQNKIAHLNPEYREDPEVEKWRRVEVVFKSGEGKEARGVGSDREEAAANALARLMQGL